MLNRLAELRAERGATAVEYGLMVALVSGVIIGTLLLLSDPVTGLYGVVNWWTP